MSELTLSGFVGINEAESHQAFISGLQRDVALAVDAAMHNHRAFMSALSDLRRDEEGDIALEVLRGDDCEAGRILGKALRRVVAANATERAKDEIAQNFGIDLDMESQS